jgi:hypothetical protein
VPAGDLVYGQKDVLTASVTSSGQPVTGGNVDFFLDGSSTAFATVPVDVGPSASTATTTVPNLTTVPTLAVGTHTFTAT